VAGSTVVLKHLEKRTDIPNPPVNWPFEAIFQSTSLIALIVFLTILAGGLLFEGLRELGDFGRKWWCSAMSAPSRRWLRGRQSDPAR